jgi:hypothetical protein
MLADVTGPRDFIISAGCVQVTSFSNTRGRISMFSYADEKVFVKGR